MKETKSVAAPTLGAVQAVALLVLVLAVVFWRSFIPGYVEASNDGPLGLQSAAWFHLPEGFHGRWDDLNSIGMNGGSASCSTTYLLLWLLGPVGYAKFMVPSMLFILAVCAWFCFRCFRLSPVACVVAALATVLSSGFFSAACWGVASVDIAFGMSYLAVGLVVSGSRSSSRLARWASYGLAGLAVGNGVIEGIDIGAIFSILVAAFVVVHALTQEGPVATRAARAFGRLATIVVFAVFIAGSAVIGLINTQIKGIVGTGQDVQTRERRWDFATQWSFPKVETLGLVVPGLFGYRMDTPQQGVWPKWLSNVYEGGHYWGKGGRDPGLDRWLANGRQGPQPSDWWRQTGGGCYLGVGVALLALWAALQALRKQGSVFAPPQRKLLWFWSAVAVVSLLLAYGRYAPFYQIVYALPYFSTVRNPSKFCNPMNFAVTMLFAYGLDALCRRYLEVARPANVSSRFRSWWTKASSFDRRWVIGCGITLALSLVAWLVYGASRESLETHLQGVGLSPATAQLVAGFSITQVFWFVLFFILAAGLLLFVLSGAFAGPRARLGSLLLGLLVVLDLGHANLPWIIHWDYKKKYDIADDGQHSSSQLIEFLRQKPHEHRVIGLPFDQSSICSQLYRIEWAQHHFLYYNIQSLDIIQMPRMPEDLAAFEGAVRWDGTSNMMFRVSRKWELTNARYLLGPAGYVQALNEQVDPVKKRFRIAQGFDIVPKKGFYAGQPPAPEGLQQATQGEDFTTVLNPQGQYAVIEFTGALPRAKLYSTWQISTNDSATLTQIGSADFDPQQSVLVANPDVPAPASAPTDSTPGTVEYASYSSKDIVLKTTSASDSVLLLNDKYDPAWKVTVDGKPAELLRCNFIMRGVRVPAGQHSVEFVFNIPIGYPTYITLSSVAAAFILIGLLVFANHRAASPLPLPEKQAERPLKPQAK